MKVKYVMLFLSSLMVLTGCGSNPERQNMTACQANALKDLLPDNVFKNVNSTSSSAKDKSDDKKAVKRMKRLIELRMPMNRSASAG